MKQLLATVFTVVFLLSGKEVYATHIFGGELLYTYVSGLNYRITLTVYGDCAASVSSSLPTATPTVQVLANGNNYTTATLAIDPGSGQEVSAVCASQVGNTSCNGGPLPGVRKFSYSTIVPLSASFTNWVFIFSGTMGTASAGRSSNITNVQNPGTQLMYLEATLNTSQGPNSSPQYTTVPTPFYCINLQQQYNQGAVDPNGDLLSFAMTDALINSSQPVTYVPPYNGTTPMATSSFNFNTVNGQMSFVPNLVQNSLVVNKVSEFRNGVLIGTSIREMTFIVLNNCSNSTPVTTVSNVQGGFTGDGSIFNICKSQNNLSFHINVTDPNNDFIAVTASSLPPGVILNIANNNTINPTVDFSWNINTVPAGTYTFFINYKDNGCPMSSQQTQAYTIKIVDDNKVVTSVVFPSQCRHKAYVKFDLSDGLLPRTIEVKQGATVIHTYIDSMGVVFDSFAVGAYTILVTSANLLCITNSSFTIVDSGHYPHPPAVPQHTYYFCKDDTPITLSAANDPGTTIHWYDAGGNLLAAAPTINTGVTGIFYYTVTQQYSVCESIHDTIKVYVTKKPVSSFQVPVNACTHDTVTVISNSQAGTDAVYNWSFDNPDFVSGAASGPYKIHWQFSGTKTVALHVVENQCPGDTMVQTVLVEQSPEAEFTFKDICLYDSMLLSFTAPNVAGSVYNWNFDGASGGSTTSIADKYLHWTTPGTKTITLISNSNRCYDSAVHRITVFPLPDIHILNTASRVCIGDIVYLKATGGTKYEWSPAERIFLDYDGVTVFTRVLAPTVYVVKTQNQYGCFNSDSLIYTDIEPCCQFSIPDAFTPNHDGKNDKFHIITYGNTISYELNIFNRFGENVFHSTSPDDSWDGKHDGRDCDMSTYFYYFKAKCYTGHIEERRGDITLYR